VLTAAFFGCLVRCPRCSLAAGSRCGWCSPSAANNWQGACQPALGFQAAPGFTCPYTFTTGTRGTTCPPVTCATLSAFTAADDSTTCTRCLAPWLEGLSPVDGPCGYCGSTGLCSAGSAAGAVNTLPYALVMPTCPLAAWRFGSSNVAASCTSAVPTTLCGQLSCGACASSGVCAWCGSAGACVPLTAVGQCASGVLRGLKPDASSRYNDTVRQCPGFCASVTDGPACLAVPSCLWCTATQQCLQAGSNGPVDGPPACATGFLPPTSNAAPPLPRWIVGSTPGGFGLLPGNPCGQFTSCRACLYTSRLPGQYGASATGCGWCRSGPDGGGACIPGNTTFGPYNTAGSCSAADWFPYSCSGRCVGASRCKNSTSLWGCGWCASDGNQRPGTADGPVTGVCSGPWTTSPSSCGVIEDTGTLSLSNTFLEPPGAAMSRVASFHPLVSQCDAVCLTSTSITLINRDSSTQKDMVSGSIAFGRRSVSTIPGCTCLSLDSAPMPSPGAVLWAAGGTAGPALALSSLPSDPQVRFSFSFSADPLAPVVLETWGSNAPAGTPTYKAYFSVR